MLKQLSLTGEAVELATKTRRTSTAAKFHTVTQVAEILGVSTRTIRRWIADHELAVHRFGSAVRIAAADLKVFLALHRED